MYLRTFLIVFIYLLLRVLIADYYLVSQTKVPVSLQVRRRKIAHQSTKDNFLCHYLEDNGVLPDIDKAPPVDLDSIFFIESSCKDITSRQACSVESAARANSHRQVNVLFTSPLRTNHSIMEILLTISNIRALRIHLENYAEGTPLDGKFMKKPLHPDDLNMELADVLKFLTIFKYTGTFLSMDVLVARNFDNLLKNWIVKETLGILSTDMFTFSQNDNGRAMAHIALNVIVSNLAMVEGNFAYHFDNDFVMKQFVQLWCGVTDVLFLNSSDCQELEVGSPKSFFPISFRNRRNYFIPGQLEQFNDKEINTFGTWESNTNHYLVNNDSLYAILAKKYCPTIYNFYGHKFGNDD